MLTGRQKQWLNTTTYDSKTENPLLHRLCACVQRERERGGGGRKRERERELGMA